LGEGEISQPMGQDDNTDKNNRLGLESTNHNLAGSAPGELSESVLWIIWYLRRFVQADELYSKRLQKEYEISQGQLSCLLALYRYGPGSLSKLAERILVKPGTITGIIDRLEAKGLVARKRNFTDRRVITIELTEKGHAFAERAPAPVQRSIIKGLSTLSEEKLEAIVKIFQFMDSLITEGP
jgi:MarR family transcriptional regulator, organic hydroperoxide resistance regulator